jgi:hypothetical protein
VNVGLALLGIVGGLVVGGALAVQARRDRALDLVLAERGTASTATIVAVVATGRHLAFRRVTFSVAGEGEFMQTFPFIEAGSLGLVEGAQLRVVHLADPSSGVLRGRLVQPSNAPANSFVPLVVGLFIAVLGIAAALVV